MKILNIGSLNIDKVYSVDHFVQAGETLTAPHAETFSGGKGLNQSVALARAGAEVYAAGAVGPDGLFLKALLEQSGADTRYLQVMEGEVTGHAIIQKTDSGENCILLYGGANRRITRAQIDRTLSRFGSGDALALTETYIDDTLSHFGPGDLLLLQNETSNVPYAMKKARELGLKVAFNASPITAQIFEYPLELVDYFIINEIEGQAIAGCEETGHKAILAALAARFPKAVIVMTLGKDGVLYHSGEEEASHGVYASTVVDTTAAGDTFCGYFLASVARGLPAAEALRMASLASALAIGVKGAANSIPGWAEVEQYSAGR